MVLVTPAAAEGRPPCRSSPWTSRSIGRPSTRERAAMRRGRLSGCRLRRGRTRAAGRAGGGRRRDPGPRAHSGWPRRFQEARRRATAKSCTSASARPPTWASRSDRASGSTATTSGRPRCGRLLGAVAALPVRPRLVLVDGIDRIEAGCDCEAIVARRCAGGVDRGRLDRRQGGARPPDAADRGRPSGLRLRAPHGLRGAGASPRARGTRTDRPSPPQLRPCGCRLPRGGSWPAAIWQRAGLSGHEAGL